MIIKILHIKTSGIQQKRCFEGNLYLHQKRGKTQDWWAKCNLKVRKKDQTIDSKKAEGTVNSKKVIKIKTALSERESKKQ